MQNLNLEAVRRIAETGESMRKVASELGVKYTTMQGWVSRYRKSPQTPFIGSGNISPEDKRVKDLEKENKELKEA